jgi:SAM-dependent methyltransferase
MMKVGSEVVLIEYTGSQEQKVTYRSPTTHKEYRFDRGANCKKYILPEDLNWFLSMESFQVVSHAEPTHEDKPEPMFDPNVYNESFYQALADLDYCQEGAFHAVLAHLGTPKSMLDLGCGSGYMLTRAHQLGISPVVGVELSEKAFFGYRAYECVVHDLCEPLDLEYQFDLVCCWEVAEHLPPSKANILCDTIAVHTGKYLVFTAAQPWAIGYYHYNEQPLEYWREKLVARKLVYRESLTKQLRETWKYTTGPCSAWLVPNVQVFSKRE